MKHICAALCLLALAACSSRQTTDPLASERYETRRDALLAETAWRLSGRLAINDGDDGGSGRVSWRTAGDTSLIEFSGALGRGAWRLTVDADGAVLQTADGDAYHAAGVDELIERQVGWPIPVDALEWWVRGLPAPGDIESLELDREGLPKTLVQDGWTVKYSRYTDVSGIRMPVRLNALSGERRVKLAVSRWTRNTQDGA